MKALYRRYRPLRLEDVIGQSQVTTPLASAIKAGKINHAYLFTGPRGTGKTTVARIFAHLINGFNYELEDEYVDIIEIDGASNRGIENIRDIREKATIAPTAGKYKVYIIDEVHMLTKEAFNALLKTLEEPPEHVVFIMATTDAYKVPVTITSRSQTYNFKLAPNEEIFEHLKKIAKEEKINIDDDALKIVVRKGGGSFRDSLSLLDQISAISSEKITAKTLEDAMGLPSVDKTRALLDAYTGGDVQKVTTLLKDYLSTGIKAETLNEELISSIIESPNDTLLGLLTRLVDVKPPFAEARLLIALVGCQTGTTVTTPRAETGPAPTMSRAEAKPSTTTRPPVQNTEAKDTPASTDAKMSNFQKFLASRGKLSQGSANVKNDTLNSKISDIMGGEVQEYGGGNPF